MLKKLSAAIALILVAASFFALCACEHVHSYSNQWTYNESEHWLQATCEHSDEESGRAPHDMQKVDGQNCLKCEVCGYTQQLHVHTYAASWTYDQTHHWRKALCEHTDEITAKSLHEFNGNFCKICGAPRRASDILAEAASNLQIWQYTFKSDNLTVTLDGQSITLDDCEIAFDVDENGLNGRCCGKVFVDGASSSFIAVIRSNVAYVIIDGDTYLMQPLDVWNSPDNKAAVDEIVKQLDEQSAEIALALEQLSAVKPSYGGNGFAFVKDEQASIDGKDVYVLDYDGIRNNYIELSVKTVSMYFDEVFGEDAFDNMETVLGELLSNTVGDCLKMLEENGVTVDDLANLCNYLVAEYVDGYDSADEIVAQYNFIPGSKVGTVKGLLNNAYVRMLPVGTVLDAALTSMGKSASSKDIICSIAEYAAPYRDKTVYDLVAQVAQDYTAEQLVQLTGYVIDSLENCIDLSFEVSQDEITKIALTFKGAALNGQAYEGTLPSDVISVIDNVFGIFDGKLELVKDYESTVEYSEVIDKVLQNVAAE